MRHALRSECNDERGHRGRPRGRFGLYPARNRCARRAYEQDGAVRVTMVRQRARPPECRRLAQVRRPSGADLSRALRNLAVGDEEGTVRAAHRRLWYWQDVGTAGKPNRIWCSNTGAASDGMHVRQRRSPGRASRRVVRGDGHARLRRVRRGGAELGQPDHTRVPGNRLRDGQEPATRWSRSCSTSSRADSGKMSGRGCWPSSRVYDPMTGRP